MRQLWQVAAKNSTYYGKNRLLARLRLALKPSNADGGWSLLADAKLRPEAECIEAANRLAFSGWASSSSLSSRVS